MDPFNPQNSFKSITPLDLSQKTNPWPSPITYIPTLTPKPVYLFQEILQSQPSETNVSNESSYSIPRTITPNLTKQKRRAQAKRFDTGEFLLPNQSALKPKKESEQEEVFQFDVIPEDDEEKLAPIAEKDRLDLQATPNKVLPQIQMTPKSLELVPKVAKVFNRKGMASRKGYTDDQTFWNNVAITELNAKIEYVKNTGFFSENFKNDNDLSLFIKLDSKPHKAILENYNEYFNTTFDPLDSKKSDALSKYKIRLDELSKAIRKHYMDKIKQ